MLSPWDVVLNGCWNFGVCLTSSGVEEPSFPSNLLTEEFDGVLSEGVLMLWMFEPFTLKVLKTLSSPLDSATS